MTKRTSIKALVFATLALMLNACMPTPDPIPESFIKQFEEGAYPTKDELLKECSDTLEKMPLFYEMSNDYNYCKEYDSSVKLSQVAQKSLDTLMVQINNTDAPTEKDSLNAALMFAATAGDLKSLNKLLEMGADPNAENALHMTALMTAANSIHPDCVEALLNAGATPNIQDAQGLTALMLASNNVLNAQSVRLLIQKGADVNIKAKNGSTALLIATQKDCTQSTYDLIKAGADVNVSDPNSGFTPLLFAASQCNHLSIQFLVDAGAEVNVKSSLDGVTPILITASCAHPDSALILLNAGANPNISMNNGTSIADIMENRKNDPFPFIDEEDENALQKAVFIARARRLFIF